MISIRPFARARRAGAATTAAAAWLSILFVGLAPSPLHGQRVGRVRPAPAIATPRIVAHTPAQSTVQCQKCHANRDFLVGKGSAARGDTALFVPDSLLRDSKHAKLACADCHPGYDKGYPHNTAAVAVPCRQCHAPEDTAWAKSIHAPNAKTVGDAPTCVTCHTQHHVLGADDPRSPTYPLNVAKTCGSCHDDKRIIGAYFKNTNDRQDAQARTAVAEYYQTVHGLAATKAGLVVAATCSDCHGPHLIMPADSAASTLSRANVAKTCGACHAGVLATFDSSSHGKALVSGKKTDTGHGAPVCIDCHEGHKIVTPKDSAWFRGIVWQCGECHERVTKTYFETYHGQVTELGFGITAKCSDCHTAHAMLPPSDARSSVNQANLVATCGKCHAGANAKFVAYMPHADPQSHARNPGLYWVWLFMTLLLVSVFAFFGTHTALWLLRLAVDRVRGRGPGEHEDVEDHGEPGGGVAAPASLPSTVGEPAPSRTGGGES